MEVFQKGYAFTEIVARRESIAQQREEVDHQRKQLAKMKPSLGVASEKKQTKQRQAQKEGDLFVKPAPPIK